MIVIKDSTAEKNFKSVCDKAFGGETVIISRTGNKNVVMVSEEEYDEIIRAKKNAEYIAMIEKSIAEAESGGIIAKSAEELESYE